MRFALFFIGLASFTAALLQGAAMPAAGMKHIAIFWLGAVLLAVALAMQARVSWRRRREAMPTRRFIRN